MKKVLICIGLIWLGSIITAVTVYVKEQNAKYQTKSEIANFK